VPPSAVRSKGLIKKKSEELNAGGLRRGAKRWTKSVVKLGAEISSWVFVFSKIV